MSTDLRTQLNNCQTFANGWTAAAQGGDNTTTGQFYEGTGSIESQHSNADEETWTNQDSGGTTFNLDWSDTTLYLLIKDNLIDTYANGGFQLVIGDGTNRIGYDVGGNDAVGLVLRTGFASLRLDISEVVAAPGTNFATYAGTEANLTQTAITQVGYGSLHLAKAVGNVPNSFIDSITYIANGSYALRINGGTVGTPETMVDVAGDDVTNGWGIIGNPLGQQYQFGAPVEWGEPAANADSYFTATDEQWYLVGDNAGGRAIGAGNFFFRVVGNATDTNSWVITRVTVVNTGTRASFDVSSGDMDTMQIDACIFTDLGAMTFPLQDAGNKFVNDTVFNNCDQMDLQSCDMDGNTWNGTTDANGAIVWDDNTTDVQNQDNFTFNSDGTGHAIEIAPTGAGPFTYNISGYTFDGYAGQTGTSTDRVFYINPTSSTADITINLTGGTALNVVGGGSGFSWRERAGYTGTVTINQTVTLTVNVVDTNAVAVPYAKVRIEDASTGALISDGFANNLGVFVDSSYNYSADTDVVVVVRKNSPGDTRYLETRQPATITNSGLTTTVSLNEDSIAGFIPMKGILKTGVVFEYINDSALTMSIDIPEGTSRKLVCGFMYWDSTTDLTVSSATYDGNAMTNEASASVSEQEGAGNFHEIQYYRYDIPDADTGEKDVVITWSAAVTVKAIAFAIIDDTTTGAADNAANNVGDTVTTNPSVTLNNSAEAWSVVFLITDDTDSPSPTGVASLRRSDQIAEPSPDFDGQMVAVLTADRTATGSHSLGADYGANTKTWVAGGATFLKN